MPPNPLQLVTAAPVSIFTLLASKFRNRNDNWHRYLLMNFHVVQFQYIFELIRLTYSQIVQTFQEHHPMGSWSQTIEFHHIWYRSPEHHRFEDREKNRRMQYCIMSTNDSKVVVDHVGDLSSSKKPILFLDFLFLKTDLLLEVRIWDDLVQSRGNSRVQHLEIREILTCN